MSGPPSLRNCCRGPLVLPDACGLLEVCVVRVRPLVAPVRMTCSKEAVSSCYGGGGGWDGMEVDGVGWGWGGSKLQCSFDAVCTCRILSLPPCLPPSLLYLTGIPALSDPIFTQILNFALCFFIISDLLTFCIKILLLLSIEIFLTFKFCV